MKRNFSYFPSRPTRSSKSERQQGMLPAMLSKMSQLIKNSMKVAASNWRP